MCQKYVSQLNKAPQILLLSQDTIKSNRYHDSSGPLSNFLSNIWFVSHWCAAQKSIKKLHTKKLQKITNISQYITIIIVRAKNIYSMSKRKEEKMTFHTIKSKQ